MHVLRRGLPLVKALMVIALLLYGVAAVLTVIPLLGRLEGPRNALRAQRICTHWRRLACRILNIHTHISGSPCVESSVLLIANHISWLDIIAIGAQQPMIFVAKQEVAGWPVLGFLAAHIGTLFVDRGNSAKTRRTAEKMARVLQDGGCLMLFPEGTTTRGDRVLRFHPRLFQPAQSVQSPVQAIAIRYGGPAAGVAPFIGDDAFVPHILRVIRLKRIDLHLHYCPPLPASQERNRLANAAREQIIAALNTADTAAAPSEGGFSKTGSLAG